MFEDSRDGYKSVDWSKQYHRSLRDMCFVSHDCHIDYSVGVKYIIVFNFIIPLGHVSIWILSQSWYFCPFFLAKFAQAMPDWMETTSNFQVMPQLGFRSGFDWAILANSSSWFLNQKSHANCNRFTSSPVFGSIHHALNPDQFLSPCWWKVYPQHVVTTTMLHCRYGVLRVIRHVEFPPTGQMVQSWSR